MPDTNTPQTKKHHNVCLLLFAAAKAFVHQQDQAGMLAPIQYCEHNVTGELVVCVKDRVAAAKLKEFIANL